MQTLLLDYLPLVVFIGISLVIGIALMVAPFAVAYKNPDPEKLSAYECGFNAFDDARMKFDVRFYLVAILFIIFDLEVAFLFPWAVALQDIGAFGFWSMMSFLFVLTGPSLLLAQVLFYGYVVTRLLHFLAYLTAQTHDVRATLWTPGSLIVLYMAGQVLWSAFVA